MSDRLLGCGGRRVRQTRRDGGVIRQRAPERCGPRLLRLASAGAKSQSFPAVHGRRRAALLRGGSVTVSSWRWRRRTADLRLSVAEMSAVRHEKIGRRRVEDTRSMPTASWPELHRAQHTPTLAATWQAMAGVPIGDGLLEWPPDVFAFTEVILERTQVYRLLFPPPRVVEWPPRRLGRWSEVVEEAPSNGARGRRIRTARLLAWWPRSGVLSESGPIHPSVMWLRVETGDCARRF